MAQMKVFVSHSSKDKAFCDALVSALRTAGVDVWYDQHNLGAGVLRREINDQLAERPIVIVIVSKAALISQWVQDECEWAYNLYRRKPNRLILPVVAAPYDPDDFDHMLFLESLKRVEAPSNKPFPIAEAIARTLRLLQLTPAGQHPEPAAPQAGESRDDLLAKGKALSAQYKYAEAIPSFERATQIDPNSFDAWFNLGVCRDELHQGQQALAAFERAIGLNDQSAEAWYMKARLLKGNERVDAFRRAVNLDIGFTFAWQGLVAALKSLGRLEEAEREKQRALDWGWWV